MSMKLFLNEQLYRRSTPPSDDDKRALVTILTDINGVREATIASQHHIEVEYDFAVVGATPDLTFIDKLRQALRALVGHGTGGFRWFPDINDPLQLAVSVLRAPGPF